MTLYNDIKDALPVIATAINPTAGVIVKVIEVIIDSQLEDEKTETEKTETEKKEAEK